MAQSTMSEASQIETPSSPESASGTANDLKARKDRNCPFCGQAFTSSSLGRHLDLYIKPRNPKNPDGIHNIEEIRKIRGGITRRQPRTSAKGQQQQEGATKDGKDTWVESKTHAKATEDAVERSPRDAHDGRMHTFFNAANWQATGVINNLPPRDVSRDSSQTPQPHAPRTHEVRREDSTRRMFRPEDGQAESVRIDDSAENGRAAELALRELLGSLEAAAKKNADPPKLFDDFDFFALGFPGLCLAMLPPPPAIFSSTPFSVAHTWSVSPPGEQQRAALLRALHEHLSTLVNGNPGSVSDSVLFRYRVHLDGAFEHWDTLSQAERSSAWSLEICRAFSTEREKSQRLSSELAAAQQRIIHLEAEYDRISRCQLPREYLLHPPNTIPISATTVNELKATGLVSRAAEVEYDVDTLLRRWKTAVKTTAKPPRPPPQARHIETQRSELKTDYYMTGSVFGINGPMPRESPTGANYTQAVSNSMRRPFGAANSPQVSNVEEIESDVGAGSRVEQTGSPVDHANQAALVRFRSANHSPITEMETNANGKRPLNVSSANGRRSTPKVYKERAI